MTDRKKIKKVIIEIEEKKRIRVKIVYSVEIIAGSILCDQFNNCEVRIEKGYEVSDWIRVETSDIRVVRKYIDEDDNLESSHHK